MNEFRKAEMRVLLIGLFLFFSVVLVVVLYLLSRSRGPKSGERGFIFQADFSLLFVAKVISKLIFRKLNGDFEAHQASLPDGSARVRTLLAGVCGSDVSILRLKTGLYGVGTTIQPKLCIGHENVGIVEAVADATKKYLLGKRVVADPVFHCRLCPPCKHGELNHCLAGETFAVGGSLSGSWSTSFSCPTSNLFVVPDNVSDRSAVLVEPLAVGLHAALRIGPQVLEKNLFVVIGAGAIGLLQVAALRHLSPNSTIVTVARYSFQREAAKRIGSHHVVAGSEELLPLLAQLSNATIIKQKSSFLKKIGSDDVLLGGADFVFDCVCSARSLRDSALATKPGGSVVCIGVTAPTVAPSDVLLIREVNLVSSFCYQVEAHTKKHTFETALEMLSTTDFSWLVTHEVPLSDVERAIRLSECKQEAKSIKVVLKP